MAKLVDNLTRKLSIYVESVNGSAADADVAKSWREICRLEAEYVVIPPIMCCAPLTTFLQGAEE